MDQKQTVAILRILRDANGPVGSAEIARGLELYGFSLSARTVRMHLEDLEDLGLVSAARRGRGGGRRITAKGLSEINDALLLERVGLTAAKVDTMACQTTFDVASGSGNVVLNISTIDRRALPRAMREMAAVFRRDLGMGEHMILYHPGDNVNGFRIPTSRYGIGTVCSVTLNGVLLNRRIPTVSRFGGVLELVDGQPVRFTDAIYYNGTSLDPLEIFIKGGLLQVRQAAADGNGRIGASFREVPTCALDRVLKALDALERARLGRALLVGRPGQPLLGVPVPEGRTALIVAGGLNPVAAVEEAGIPTRNAALSHMVPAARLQHYLDLARELGIAVD